MIDFIKEFESQKLKDKFNKDLDEIPVWIWIFWLPILFENFNFYQDNEEKYDFFFYILKKVANKYKNKGDFAKNSGDLHTFLEGK